MAKSEPSLPANFGERIKRLRGRLGLTQTQLAELLGVSFASVNRWENAQSRPSALAWRQLSAADQRGIEAFDSSRPADPNPGTAPRTIVHNDTQPPPIDFSSDSRIVRAVAEAERLAHGYLFNPAFATETSLIDPLPHQRIAVYEHMLAQPRLRFLLADDAGAGKTIMAGLYIREMLARRLISRVMIVPPAGLIGNWESELRKLFGLRFRIVTGADARSSNPFVGSDGDLIIVSVDTLSGDRMFARLRESGVVPYDLAVFDEAHKLSARLDTDLTFRRTDRYRAAEALGGVRNGDQDYRLNWSCRHLLLLTATPHMGKDYPYYFLWRLLEPEVLPTKEAFDAYPPDSRRRHFIRRTKEEMVTFDGSRIYPNRVSDTLSYDLSVGEISEQTLYDRTTDYIRDHYNRARILNRSAAQPRYERLSATPRQFHIFHDALVRATHREARQLDRRHQKWASRPGAVTRSSARSR